MTYLVEVELINFPHHLDTYLFDSSSHREKLPLWEQSKVTRSCYYPRFLAETLLLNFNFPDRHGFWGSGHRYPPRDAEINRFCSQLSW